MISSALSEMSPRTVLVTILLFVAFVMSSVVFLVSVGPPYDGTQYRLDQARCQSMNGYSANKAGKLHCFVGGHQVFP